MNPKILTVVTGRTTSMGVSLLEVIEAGGYNLATTADASWLLSKQEEFAELIEQAENKLEDEE